MKKIIAILLVMLFVFSAVKLSFAQSSVSVSISDNYIGRSTTYKIIFVANSSISKGDSISLIFDDSIPIFRNGEKAKEILVNGVKVEKTPKFFGHRIDVFIPVNIDKGKRVEIVLPQGIVQNPSAPGYFILTVKANGDTYQSNYYHITDKSTVKNVELTELEDGIEIDFTTGENGALKGYITKTVGMGRFGIVKAIPQDFIFIRFSHILSESFSSVSKNDVTVNGKNPPLNPEIKTHFKDTENEEKELIIPVPDNINANSKVKVIIKGILPKNTLTGALFAKVRTSKEITPVISNAIEVKSVYFIKTLCTVFPKRPDGENGFYITKPEVEFAVDKGRDIDKVETFYGFDGKNFTPYSGKFYLADGDRTLYYYSVGFSGNRKFAEPVQKFHFLIDSSSPAIKLVSPLKTNTPLYTLKIKFSDANFDYALIRISGIEFTATDEDFEIPVYLFDKTTRFTVKAFDKAGNSSEFNGTILLKE